MTRYIVRRILQAIFVLWGAISIVFVVVRVVPGDPASLLLGPSATRDQIAAAQHAFGLDQPLYVQYVHYLGDAAQLNFGESSRLGGRR